MNRHFILPLFCLIILSCAKDLNNGLDDIDGRDSIVMETTSYSVSMKDVNKYLNYKNISTKSDNEISNIEVFGQGKDTLLYIVNYQRGGWEILSGDKRTPYLLGESETGSFTMKDYEETPWGTWMYTVAMDVLNTKTRGRDVGLDENENLKFWTLITEPEKILPSLPETKVNDGPVILIGGGHYELTDTYITFENDVIPHLMSTKWDQGALCNYYCPYKSFVDLDDPSLYLYTNEYNCNVNKAPAGCVAIAAAQVLYYLHYKIGVPATAPTYAECQGKIPNYSMYAGGPYSSTIWDAMCNNDGTSTTSAAPLVALIGLQVGMNYGDSGSGADLQPLVNNTFHPFGISCTYSNSYSTTVVKDQLYYRHEPVIVGAYPNIIHTRGHAFVIDGCKSTVRHVVYVYNWIYDNPNALQGECHDPYTVEVSEHFSLDMIQMNWGQHWSNFYDVNWFSPGGDWEMTPGTNYKYARKMISGFSVMQ